MMIIHLAIIGGILVIGGIVLYPYNDNSLPTNSDIDQAKNNLVDFADDTINTVGATFENTYDKVSSTVDDTIDKIG